MKVCCSETFPTNHFDLSLTTVGAQPNVNMNPEAQRPEFL